jgi:hypothetical protein
MVSSNTSNTALDNCNFRVTDQEPARLPDSADFLAAPASRDFEPSWDAMLRPSEFWLLEDDFGKFSLNAIETSPGEPYHYNCLISNN